MDSSESDYSWSFATSNIIDYEELCLQAAYFKAPNIREIILSLEAFAKECKSIADKNGVEYDNYSLVHFLKELLMTNCFEIEFLDFLVHINYSLFKSKFFDNFKNTLINQYIHHVEKRLSTSLRSSAESGKVSSTFPIDSAVSGKSPSTSHQAESIVKKLLKVFQVLKPNPELSFESLVQYEFLAELLKICYSENVQDTHLVISLLKLTIDRYVSVNSGITNVRQPHYPHGFFKYILKHVTRAKFDLVQYYSDNYRTDNDRQWDYVRNFSVVCATSFGNADRVLCLLQHGFNIFPNNEACHSGHGHPHVKEIMTRTNRMVLQIMSRMRLVNCFTSDSDHPPESSYYNATSNQEECFRLIWRAISEPYVRSSQLSLDISTEYFYLALHAIFKPFRHSRNLRLGAMYETCFKDMAVGPHEPRSLKHLSRCTIRKSLRQSWSLPNGVFQLGLPNSLEKYLNLECD